MQMHWPERQRKIDLQSRNFVVVQGRGFKSEDLGQNYSEKRLSGFYLRTGGAMA